MNKQTAIPLLLLLQAAAGQGASNSVTVTDTGGVAQTNRPFTISRYFTPGEIASYARPRINGVPADVWQDDVKTRWPDGSLRHTLISFTASLAANGSIAVDFVNSANACSLGSQSACTAAALTQTQMVNFNSGGWGASIQANAAPQGSTATQAVSARSLLNGGKWSYWLAGPVVTQVIAEDTSTARAYDFGWKEKKIVSLPNTVQAADTAIPVLDATDLAALATPFTIQIDDESISISAVTGNTLKVAARGVNGTSAALHYANWYASNYVFSQPLTSLSANMATADVTATVASVNGISAGDIISIDLEHLRVCAVSGTTLKFGSGTTLPCASGDANGRGYDGTTAVAHHTGHFVVETAASDRWSNAPSASFQSLHPAFVLTFYTGWPGVKEEFILENDWPDRAQDQYYDVMLRNGAGESATAWSSSSVKQIPFTRWRKTFWDGAAPAPVDIDFNLKYLRLAGLVPYDPSITPSQAAINNELSVAQPTQIGTTPYWGASSQCNPDTAGFNGWLNNFNGVSNQTDGMMVRDMEMVGGRGELGLFPRWIATYLYTMRLPVGLSNAAQVYNAAIGQAECAAHVPLHYREYDNNRSYCALDSCSSAPNNTVSAFGRPVSVEARPTVAMLNPQNGSFNDALSRQSGPGTNSDWHISIGHNPSLLFIPYLVTGDYYLLQELQHWAAFDVANASQVPVTLKPSQNPNLHQRDTYRHADWGYLDMTDGLRGQAWSLRDLGYAALMSPDGTAEKEYFTKKLDTNIAILEGKYNITNGSYYNDCYSPTSADGTFDCSYWTFGRQYKGMGSPNPLHFENVPSSYGGGNDTDQTYTYFYFQPFMQRYLQVVLGHLNQLGFLEITPLRKAVLSSLINQVKNPAVQNPAVVEAYMSPNTPCKPEGAPSAPDCSRQAFALGDAMWFTSWANWYNAISPARKANTQLTSAGDLIGGYAILARAAAAFATDVTDGAVSGTSAWEWLDANISSKAAFAGTPMWAFVPPATIRVVPRRGRDEALLSGSCSSGEAVRVAAGSGPLPSDDSSDTPASMNGALFTSLWTGLSPSTTYTYRVTCGTTRTTGSFTTASVGGEAVSLTVQLAPPASLHADHAVVSYGPSPTLGQNSAPVACASGCSVMLNGSRGQALYYQVSFRDVADRVMAAGSVQVVLPE
jgi:hypothetical protein